MQDKLKENDDVKQKRQARQDKTKQSKTRQARHDNIRQKMTK